VFASAQAFLSLKEQDFWGQLYGIYLLPTIDPPYWPPFAQAYLDPPLWPGESAGHHCSNGTRPPTGREAMVENASEEAADRCGIMFFALEMERDCHSEMCPTG